jgi:hypothetical protein
MLALICHDEKHATRYTIDEDGKCYYKGKFIGEIREKYEEKDDEIHHNIYFRPVTPIEYINVNITISSTGAEVKN